MRDDKKTKKQLLNELTSLREELALQKSPIGENLLEQSPIGYQSLDKDGVIIAINTAWQDQLGYSRDQVIGRWFGDFLLPESKEKFERNFPEFISEGKIHNIEFDLLSATGEVITMSFNGKAIYDIDGNFKKIHCVISDITQRVSDEKKLRKSEKYLSSILHAVPAGIITISNWVITDVNEHFCQMLGYTQGELIGASSGKISPSNEEYRMVYETASAQIEKIGSGELETRLVRKDGSTLNALVKFVSQDPEAPTANIILAILDITEQKLAERTILDRTLFLNHILDSMQHPFYVINIDDYSVVLANQSARNLNPGGQTCYALTHGRDKPCDGADHECPLAEIKDTHLPVIKEHIHLDANGIPSIVSVYGHPVFDQAGELIQIIEYSLDITELREAERLQNSIFRISQTAERATAQDELFEKIHQVIHEIIPVENFYIALYNEEEELIHFPYFIDSEDAPPKPQKISDTLTGQIIRARKSLLYDKATLEELTNNNTIVIAGKLPAIWLGVPLISEEKIIGVIALQDYTNPDAYGLREKILLEFIASQIARVIERNLAKEFILKQNQDLQLINTLNSLANQSAPLNDIYGLFGEKIKEILNVHSLAICLLDRDAEHLHIDHYYLSKTLINAIERVLGIKIPPISIPLEKSKFYKKVLASNKAYLLADSIDHIKDMMTDYILGVSPTITLPEKIENLFPKIFELLNIKSVLNLPLAANKKVVGLLTVSSSTTFTNDEIYRLARLAETLTLIITRKQIEMDALRLASVVDQADASILITDIEGRIQYVNPFTERITGYSLDEVIGQTPRIYKSEAQDVKFYNNLWQTLLSGNTWTGTFINKKKDGTLFHEGASIFPVKNSAGETINYAAVKQDITPEVKAKERTNRQIEFLSALRRIDTAISSSLNLKVTLKILMDQTATQLGVDAVIFLVENSYTLHCEAAIGLEHHDRDQITSIPLGKSNAGKVALARETIIMEGEPSVLSDDSFQFREFLTKENFIFYAGAPLIAKGRVLGVLEVFSRTQVNANEEWVNYFETLAGQAAIALDNITLFTDLQKSNVELSLGRDQTIAGWAATLEMRDAETEGHSQRVTQLTVQLAKKIGVRAEELVHIRRGALLHDIGKMNIPDQILHKPAALDDDEWKIMRQHPEFAYKFLAPIQFLMPALDIPRYHHEKWDGTGYPQGLKGEQIPLAARIFAIVDVWDALLSDRPYRKAWSKEKTLQHIQEQSGQHFDPKVVDVFLELVHTNSKG